MATQFKTFEQLMRKPQEELNNWQQEERKLLKNMIIWRDAFLAMHPGYKVLIEIPLNVKKAQKPEMPKKKGNS